METPMLSLVKKTAEPDESIFAGAKVVSPGYDYGELTLHNVLQAPIRLLYTIDEDQCFIPVVRTHLGEVVSRGSSFGYLRAPFSPEGRVLSIPANKTHTFKLRMPLETVPDEKRRPGVYHLRVQFHHEGKVWESNEIEINHK